MYILTKWHASNIFFWLSRSNHLKITLSFHIYRNYLSLDLCANIQRLRKINFYSMLSSFFWLVTFALPAISAVAVVNAFILIMLLIRVFQNKWSEAPCIFCHSGMTQHSIHLEKIEKSSWEPRLRKELYSYQTIWIYLLSSKV